MVMPTTEKLEEEIKEFSSARNGLMSIKFYSNVRNLAKDIREREVSTAKIEDYNVFNSSPDFDLPEDATLDDMLEEFTIDDLKDLLKIFAPITLTRIITSAKKAGLKQLLRQALLSKNSADNIQYIKDKYTNILSDRRKFNPLTPSFKNTELDINTTLLISNFHEYKRSDFKGMSLKDILRTLFDIDDHIIFIVNKVLKGDIRKKIKPEDAVAAALSKIKSIDNKKTRDNLLSKESLKNDRILKANSHLVLSLLFAAKRPFYINKKKYTILSYQQDNDLFQNPAEDITMLPPWIGALSNYSIYEVEIYLDLTELEPNEIGAQEIRKSQCHLKKEDMRAAYRALFLDQRRILDANQYMGLKLRAEDDDAEDTEDADQTWEQYKAQEEERRKKKREEREHRPHHRPQHRNTQHPKKQAGGGGKTKKKQKKTKKKQKKTQKNTKKQKENKRLNLKLILLKYIQILVVVCTRSHIHNIHQL